MSRVDDKPIDPNLYVPITVEADGARFFDVRRVIDGETLFASDDAWDSCSVDGTHPNDLGFYRMTMGIAPVLEKALEKIES